MAQWSVCRQRGGGRFRIIAIGLTHGLRLKIRPPRDGVWTEAWRVLWFLAVEGNGSLSQSGGGYGLQLLAE